MEVTRDVVLDLLPLYLADEVSPDSRRLVEAYLLTDPTLAKLAERSGSLELEQETPVPLTMEDKMEAYKDAKRWLFWRTAILAGIISVILLGLLAFVTLVAFMFLRSA